MVAAILTGIAVFVQEQYGLQSAADGRLLYFGDNALLLIALLGDVVMLAGLWSAKAAGEGIFGRISLGLLMLGTVLLFVSQAVGFFSISPDLFVVAGGIALLLGGLLTGIAVITAGQWDGWQRFAPLVQGVYFLVLLVVTVILAQTCASWSLSGTQPGSSQAWRFTQRPSLPSRRTNQG